MKHPITIRSIPTLSRLRHIKGRAWRNRTFVQLLLDEGRDLRPARRLEAVTIYAVRSDAAIGHLADRIIGRMRDGTRKVLKDRFPATRLSAR